MAAAAAGLPGGVAARAIGVTAAPWWVALVAEAHYLLRIYIVDGMLWSGEVLENHLIIKKVRRVFVSFGVV